MFIKNKQNAYLCKRITTKNLLRMKKHLRVLLLAAMATVSVGAFATDGNPLSHQVTIGTAAADSGPLRAWINGTMPCPANTVHAEPFDLSVKGNKGFGRSDMSLCIDNKGNYIRAKAFMAFDGNANPIDGIKVYGVFMNTSYTCDSVSCLSRLALDNYVPTKPLRMGVEFYTNNNGQPGDLVYSEEMDVYGEKSKGTAGDESHGEEVVPIYGFLLKTKEYVRMENGFVCVYAADTDEKQSYAFCLAHDANVTHSGILRMYTPGSPVTTDYAGCFNYCMTGDASQTLAKKGLKFTRILAPETTERGKYAKVQVELSNYGSSNISDATLRLTQDDKIIAQETIGETIYAGTVYKYTFRTRPDCSEVGTHRFTIENVTPGDDHYAERTISFNTTNNLGSCTSRSTYTAQYKYIKSVDLGDIHNESDWGQYSDYRNLKTDIKPGQTLTLNVEKLANKGDFLKVWVDWNGNGVFDDAGEFMGYVPRSTLSIKIPDNAYATAGEKTMRIIVSDKDVSPCETYTFGETEDYTLNVVRPDNTPAMTLDRMEIDVTSDNAAQKHELLVSNEGNADLNVDYTIDYRLPLSPDVSPIYKSPKAMGAEPPVVRYAKAEAKYAESAWKAEDNKALSLSYANDYTAYTGSDNIYVNYAHYYPGNALKSIAGMKISSIDIYVATPARKSFVAVWKGAGTQFMSGANVMKQQFEAVADSWNHIELDSPVTIGEEDLFIGCALEGCKNIDYLVGIDGGPTAVGFGDLICVENNNYWFSLADLGYEGNVLIRANVTGQRTPAVSWLSIDKDKATLAAGEQQKLSVSTNAAKLGGDVYDAVIRMKTNDPLASSVKVPVYLDLSTPTSIKLLEGDAPSDFYVSADRRIVLNTSSHVAYIALYTIDGRQVAIDFDTNAVSAAALPNGMYVAKAVMDDETVKTATIAVR